MITASRGAEDHGMAQQTTVILTCDLEVGEKPASQTIGFSVDGSSYEIDRTSLLSALAC